VKARALESRLENNQPAPLTNEAVPGTEEKYAAQIQKIGTGGMFNPMPIDYKWLPLFFWPFVIPTLLVAIVVGLVPFFFGVFQNIIKSAFLTCLCNCWGNPPTYAYWFFCVNAIATLMTLKTKKGRLGLFQAYQEVCGGKTSTKRASPHWWAMSGIMSWDYETVRDITKNFQLRKPFFGNNQATVPSVFPPGVSTPGAGGSFLLWVSGPKHTTIRRAFHNYFTGQFVLIKKRFNVLPSKVLNGVFETFGTRPSSAEQYRTMLNTKMPSKSWTLATELMTRSIWFIIFGCELDEEEIATCAGWQDAASYFILPQFVQNIACGLLAKKVTALRRDTVSIMCKRPGLVATFKDMQQAENLISQGGEDYSNKSLTQTMDETQFTVNFAGLLGSSQLLLSTVDFLQKKNSGNIPPKAAPIFNDTLGSNLDYIEAYNDDPIRFLKEVARLDPPVTSANAMTADEKVIQQKPCLFGGKVDVPAGTPNQYLLSLAVRDEEEFPDPRVFDPYRENWNNNLCWNGQFPFPEEMRGSNSDDHYDPMAQPTYDPNGAVGDELPLSHKDANNYNRICPGRNIALQAITMILGMCPELNHTPLNIKPATGSV